MGHDLADVHLLQRRRDTLTRYGRRFDEAPTDIHVIVSVLIQGDIESDKPTDLQKKGMVALLPAERALVDRLTTPGDVQTWLDSLAFNHELDGRTVRSFRGVVEHREAHCLEGALAAAFILGHHGHPPLLLDLWSDDELDHVVLLWRDADGWGAVGKSQYPGLQGRKPTYRSVRHLAWSYVDPYVDETGRVHAYSTFDLRALGEAASWALSPRNLRRVESALFANETTPLRASDARHARWLRRYRAWKEAHPDVEPPPSFYPHGERFLGVEA